MRVVHSPCLTRDFHYETDDNFSQAIQKVTSTAQSIQKETFAQAILQETSTQSH